MRVLCIKIAIIVTSIVSLSVIPAYSQEKANVKAPVTSSADAALQAKEIAIYGEVQSVDTAKGALAVQYYDYDSDSEKTSEILVNADTKLENAANLAAVKKGDWVDVTYTTREGVNAAKIVTIEKEELPVAEEATAKAVGATVNLPAEQ